MWPKMAGVRDVEPKLRCMMCAWRCNAVLFCVCDPGYVCKQ